MGASQSADSLNNTSRQTEWMGWSEVAKRAKPGDLIEFSRTFPVAYVDVPYKHWAVFIGHKDRVPYVIHYSNPGDTTASGERRSGWIPESVVKDGTANELVGSYIREDKLQDIAVSSQCRINNSQDTRDSPYRPGVILQRARNRMGKGNYSLFSSNCEHFARWARNGTWVSFQLSLLHGANSMALDGPDSALGRSFRTVHDAMDYDRPHPNVPYRTRAERQPGVFEMIVNFIDYVRNFVGMVNFLVLCAFWLVVLAIFLASTRETPSRTHEPMQGFRYMEF